MTKVEPVSVMEDGDAPFGTPEPHVVPLLHWRYAAEPDNDVTTPVELLNENLEN